MDYIFASIEEAAVSLWKRSNWYKTKLENLEKKDKGKS